MATIISATFLILIFIILDLVPLYQDEQWVSFFLSVSLFIVSLILAVLIGLNVDIPSPAEYIEKIITFIYGLE
ncbi:MAG: hypothetical protein ACOYIG_03150 [Acetivibrionales bacterium]|mgnify:CR=1 FL=1|jgi:ABC-type proline/glycine betaine transport system permease subunit|nr:hypothetical protein [Clostridiaceae bacterium]